MLANRDHYCPRRLTLSVTRSLHGGTEAKSTEPKFRALSIAFDRWPADPAREPAGLDRGAANRGCST